MRDWKLAFERLSAPFEAGEIRDLTEELGGRGKAKPYAPTESYLNRLKEVLGEDGFRIEYDKPQILQVMRDNGPQAVWTVNCKLSFFDEQKRYFCSCTCPGTAVIQGQADANVPTALRKARADALKACCGIYRVGGDISETWEEANGRRARSSQPAPAYRQPQAAPQASAPARNAAPAPAKAKKEPEKFKVIPAAGTFSQGNNGSFYMPVTVDGAPKELWIYKEQAEALANEASKCNRANRLDDIRNAWPSSGQHLNIMAELPSNGDTKKLYFRGLC